MFANLKHNTSPAIDGDAFASAHQGPRSLGHNMVTPSGSSTGTPHRHARRTGHGVFNVSPTHSRRDPFTVDYGLWPFDDRDYDIVCTVTNNVVNTDLSLWTPLLSEDARRQACIQYKGRCCNCGSTKHSLRWCPAPFKNMFSLLNPEFGTHDPDGSVFETWKIRMRRWRQNSPRGLQHNRRNDTGNGHPRHTNNRRHNPTQGSTQGCRVQMPPPMPEISSRDQTPHILHHRHVTRALDKSRARPACHLPTTNSIPHRTGNIIATHDGA